MKTYDRAPDGLYFYKGPVCTPYNWFGTDTCIIELGRCAEAHRIRELALDVLPLIAPEERDLFGARAMALALRAADIHIVWSKNIPRDKRPTRYGLPFLSRKAAREERLQRESSTTFVN